MLASLVGCMTMGVQNAQATTVSEVDMSERPLGTPTLDYLNKNNVTVTDLDNENPVLVPPSSYTLTKVDAAGDNTVTKFEWNESTQSFNPVYL